MIFIVAATIFVIVSIFAAWDNRKQTNPKWDEFFFGWLGWGLAVGVIFGLVVPLVTWGNYEEESYKIDDGTIHTASGIEDEYEYYIISDDKIYSLGGDKNDIEYSIGSANTVTKVCTKSGPGWASLYHIWSDCDWEVVAESGVN